jgi:hypothetical protein
MANREPKTRNAGLAWSVIAVISGLLALSAWAISSPVGSSPDDDYHNVSIWCGQGIREGLCEESTTPSSVLVPQPVYSNAFCFAGQPEKSGVCQENASLIETIRVNSQQRLYPDGYYWAMSWFASENVSSSIITMRIFNSATAIFLVLAVVVALPKHLRRIPIVSLLISIVPLGVFVLASVNPSSWTLVSVATFFASVLGLMSVSTRRERALLGGLAAISALMGFNARPDAPAYLVLAGLLAAVLSFSFKNLDRRIKLSILILSSLGALFVVWRYVYPLFTALRGIDFGVGQNAPTLQGLMFNVIRLPDLFVGAFGQWGLGWIDTPTPSSVWAVTFGIYVAVVFSSMKFFDRRQSIAAGLALLALIVVPLQFLWANNLSVGQIVQPRYLLPMIVLLAASSLHRKSTDISTGFSRGQIWAIGFGLFVANTLALHTNLRRYITGLDINQISLNFEMEWWWVERPASDTIFWFSPNYLWVAGSIAFGLLLISIWKLRSEIGLVDSKPQIKSQVNN